MIPRRTAFPALPVLLAIATLAIGCNGTLPFGATSDASATQATDRIHQQANDALQRWADAVKKSGGATITFVGELTSQVGDWEKANGGDKASLQAGLVTASPPLSDEIPSRGTVKWTDGSTVDVDVLSASAALADLVADGGGNCPTCDPLVVTDATLASSLVETSLGPAETPVWVFSIKGTAVHVTRVAVDPSVTVEPPPYNADRPPEGISIDAAFGKPGSRQLTVTFSGSPCSEFTAEAVESDLAVVVIITEQPDPTVSTGCARLEARSETKTLNLADPLGKRAVLEVRQGLPVPLNPS